MTIVQQVKYFTSSPSNERFIVSKDWTLFGCPLSSMSLVRCLIWRQNQERNNRAKILWKMSRITLFLYTCFLIWVAIYAFSLVWSYCKNIAKFKKYLFDSILIIFYCAFDRYGFLLQWLYNSQNVLHDKFLYTCVAKLLLCNKHFIR